MYCGTIKPSFNTVAKNWPDLFAAYNFDFLLSIEESILKPTCLFQLILINFVQSEESVSIQNNIRLKSL